MKRLDHFNLNRRHLSTFILILLVAVLPFSRLFSNNLSVSITNVDQNNGLVTFNLSWNNSWRDPQTVAKNWDAAWVFVKWRDCTAGNNVQFTHGTISTAVSDHTFTNGVTTFEPTLSDGSAIGIDPAPNNTGVMLRNAVSTSPNNYGTLSSAVTLKFTNMPNTTLVPSLNVKAFGIEMVYIPQATYFLGDGNGSVTSSSSFCRDLSSLTTDASINTEAAQNVFESSQSICPSSICALTASFPKGYNPFYMMKYEISQGAYCDFLNTISALAQSIHYTISTTGSGITPWNYTSTGGSRHTINMIQQINGRDTFTVDRSFRACNWLSWADESAYLAWAALRPLTEMEYEKACRGTNLATPYESAFAQTTVIRALVVTSPETGSETVSTAGANVVAGGVLTTATEGVSGPLRGGIFATATNSTRLTTGGSFYGVMELCGNVDEYYVSARAGMDGPSAGGLYSGLGTLVDSTGNSSTGLGWPHPLFPGTNGDNANNYYIIRKGGNWNSSTTLPSILSASYRATNPSSARDNASGARGGRSSSGTPPSNSQTFIYTGANQTFIVPTGITAVTMEVRGAQGGSSGGLGALARGILTVTPGQTLTVIVGGQPSNQAGGFNGGGIGGANNGGFGGGGASDVRSGGVALANRIIVAGGGGGKGGSGLAGGAGGGVTMVFNTPNYCSGGTGGSGAGSTGANGTSNVGGGAGGVTSSGGGGGGGYTTGGGLGTSGTVTNAATAGTSGQGGNGAYYSCSNGYGGGGGGGYFGGGGGGTGSCSTIGASGGGGSSAIITNGFTWTNVGLGGGVQTGNGAVTFTW